MSMFVGATSFWQQNQQNWAPSTAGGSVLSASAATLFAGANNASAPGSAQSASNSTLDSLMGPFGATMMNGSTGMAVLAAQQASDRVNAATAKLTSNAPAVSVANVATQVTFAGSLASPGVFGTTGPAQSGGFQFLTGDALKNAFTLATLGQKSNGDPVDTVSVSGNTLTASTSGINAHAVFTVTLKPSSGLYTFTLLNPIDLPTSKVDKLATLNLSLLVHGVKADGTQVTLPNSAVVEVHNGLGSADGTAHKGVVHEGGLAYTGPTNTPAPTGPVARPKYVAPINPLTGHPYSAAGSALAANAGAVNVLT